MVEFESEANSTNTCKQETVSVNCCVLYACMSLCKSQRPSEGQSGGNLVVLTFALGSSAMCGALPRRSQTK